MAKLNRKKIRPLKSRILEAEELRSIIINLVQKTIEHINTPEWKSELSDAEFVQNVLIPVQARIETDMEMIKVLNGLNKGDEDASVDKESRRRDCS